MVTVVFVCYLTTSGTHKQHAFISENNKKIRIDTPIEKSENDYYGKKLDKNFNIPVIDVQFFENMYDAEKEARVYCHPDFIHYLK